MIAKTKLLASVLVLAIGATGCDQRPDTVERWATTENTNVNIDWNKVNDAYRHASGPEDLEKRINEIYEGDEVISIAVKDENDRTQVVTGFFDRDHDGAVADNEKIFTIKREPTGEGTAQYQTTGYGPYAGYHSPFFSIASGMLMGAMLSHMFSPAYVPMYSRPYVTTMGRASDLRSQRSSFRASNPERFGPRSQSGRAYGGKPSRPSSGWGHGGGGYRGGGRFGLARAGRAVKPPRLEA